MQFFDSTLTMRIAVPESIAACSYCHQPFMVEIWEYIEEENGDCIASEIWLCCDSELEPDDHCKRCAWLTQHDASAYPHEPQEAAVLSWLARTVRFVRSI